jgi:hypothetical protein
VLLRVVQRARDGFLCNIGASVMGDGGDIIELPGNIDGCVPVTGLGAVIPSIPCWPSEESSPHATTRLELMISTRTSVLMRNTPSSVQGFRPKGKNSLSDGTSKEHYSARDKSEGSTPTLARIESPLVAPSPTSVPRTADLPELQAFSIDSEPIPCS